MSQERIIDEKVNKLGRIREISRKSSISGQVMQNSNNQSDMDSNEDSVTP